ncbi:MAG: polysaccharide deacetylase family protein [Candidatus Melainabacteria bacterium]|nr:polysaccharide deacetylase family protein [Candidatus Melainabacteria bacterium]
MALIKSLNDMKMDMMTGAARSVLPSGYWHHPADNSESPCHLTFDDGPFPETTPRLLEMLDEHNVKATFFFTGRNVEKYPELAKLTKDRGHQIGNHTYSHLAPLFIPKALFEKEVDAASLVIKNATGEAPTVFRPPYGLIDPDKAVSLKERNLMCVYWGPVAEDWNDVGVSEVVRRIVRQTRSGSLIVLHESTRNSRQCIKSTLEIVKWSVSKGLKFAPIQ